MNSNQTGNIAEFIASRFANASSELAEAVKVIEGNDGFCVALTKRVGDEAFNAYRESARRLGMRFNPDLRAWCISKEAMKARMGNVVGKFWRSFIYIPKNVLDEQSLSDLRNNLCYTIDAWRRDPETGRVEKTELTICHMKEEEDGIRVPRGLALKAAKVLGVNIPDFAPDLKEPGEEYMKGLRDYQKEVFKNVAAQLKKTGAAVVQMATGAGKSFLAGAMAKWLNDQGYKVFLVALSKDLVLQLKDYAERAGAKDVVAVTVQTLIRRLGGDKEDLEDEEDKEIYEAYADEYSSVPEDELVKQFKDKKVAVILDEAHHVPAATVRKVMMEAGDGWALRIGLTATPFRNDGRDMDIYAYAGTVVEPKITSSYLIRNGYAVPVTIKILKAPECEEALRISDELRMMKRRDGARAFAEIRKALLGCGLRNQFIAELAAGAEKPVLVITPLVKHAELLGKMLKELGVKAEVVTGAVKAEKRKEIFDALRRGEVEAIVATTLADEGLDLPPLRTLIIAFGGRSKTRVLQRIGRLVRPYSGKTHATAIELEDEGVEYVMDHLAMRKELYSTEPDWRIVEAEEEIPAEEAGGWSPAEVGGWSSTEEESRHSARPKQKRRKSRR
jgi:superfamily II DNA or RNA helicase